MAAPLTGQVALTTSVTSQLTTVSTEVTAFEIKAPLTNTLPVYLGPAGVTTATGHQLDPGDDLQYEALSQNGQPLYRLRPSDFFVAGTTGDKVTWLASPA